MKERVDVLAATQGLFETREQARRGVMAGLVVAEASGERFDKPGQKIDATTSLRLKGEKLRYVSRGGLKLEKALTEFELTDAVAGAICLDIGASTGGFTDVLLQNGARAVYAVDVGTNQLVWKLRQDPRVVVMEHYNFRQAQLSDFEEAGRPRFATIDVSFISLALILPPLWEILPALSPVVALIKPQFEAGRAQVGKNGIIKDRAIHKQVLEKVLSQAADIGFACQGLTYSPIKGGAGNVEFLAKLVKVPKNTDQAAAMAQLVNKNITIEAVIAAEEGEFKK